jgi:hypothetical protein
MCQRDVISHCSERLIQRTAPQPNKSAIGHEQILIRGIETGKLVFEDLHDLPLFR